MVTEPTYHWEKLSVGATTLIGIVLSVFPATRWVGFAALLAVSLWFIVWIGRAIEYHRLMSRPHIDFQIHDAHIVPDENRATCFLHVSLHNRVGPRVANPPVQAYSLTLDMGGKSYPSSMSIDPEVYELGFYKWGEYYDNENGERREALIRVGTDKLYRIGTKSDDLVPGTRLYGWIAFVVRDLPLWKTDTEVIGVRTEYAYEDDGTPDPNSAHPVEIEQKILNTRDVESLTLSVHDAYNQKWAAKALQPFTRNDKKIVKRKSNYR